MEIITKTYHPNFFDLDKIYSINSAFVEYCYIGDDKYESVQAEKHSHNDDVITYFKNGERIHRNEFVEKTKKKFMVEKNRMVFLVDYYVCYFDIYIKKDFQILPIVRVEFSDRQDLENFEPLKWFGLEVSDKLFNEKALYKSLQVVE